MPERVSVSETSNTPVVVVGLAEEGLSEHLIFEGLDYSDVPEPNFNVSETARFFFRRSGDWIRWRESKGNFIYDDKPIVVQRTDGGARIYTLPDIELMAHGLAQQRLIDGEGLLRILRVIHAEATLWGHFDEDDEEDEDA